MFAADAKPQFKHACPACEFLGRYHGRHRVYDLYYCTRGPGPTILARYSDRDSGYESGMIVGRQLYEMGGKDRHPLAVAYREAVQRGLIQQPVKP